MLFADFLDFSGYGTAVICAALDVRHAEGDVVPGGRREIRPNWAGRGNRVNAVRSKITLQLIIHFELDLVN
jgi:hypothetical protein